MFAKVQDPEGDWYGLEVICEDNGQPHLRLYCIGKQRRDLPVLSWNQVMAEKDIHGDIEITAFRKILEDAVKEYHNAWLMRGVEHEDY